MPCANAEKPDFLLNQYGKIQERWRTPACVALLAFWPMILFWREFLGQRVFFHADIQNYFLPYHHLASRQIHQGYLPLWNPSAFSGMPLLADGQTSLFYPPNWCFLFLPTPHAFNIVVLLQFSIAGVGMFLWMRALRTNRLPSLVAAVAFMFCGFMTARVVHLSIMSGVALLPWIFWSYERVWQAQKNHRIKHFATFAFCVALMGVCGHPQVPIYGALALALYAMVVSVLEGKGRLGKIRSLGKAWCFLLAGFAGALVLASAQLLPWFELAQQSPRASHAVFRMVTAFSPKDLDALLLVYPYAFGGLQMFWPQTGAAFSHTSFGSMLWEKSIYMGVATLPLALVGILRVLVTTFGFGGARIDTAERENELERFSRARGWALVLTLIVFTLFALGSRTFFGEMIYALPVVGKLRAYIRAGAIFCLMTTALAAFGFQYLWSQSPRRIAGALTLICYVFVVFSLGAVAAPGIPAFSRTYAVKNLSLYLGYANLWWPLVLVVVCSALIYCSKAKISPRSAVVLFSILALDMSFYARSFNHVRNPEDLQRVPPTVQWLREQQQQEGDFRIAVFVRNESSLRDTQNTASFSWAMQYDLPEINGFNSLQTQRYTHFLFGKNETDVSYGYLANAELLNANEKRLDWLQVRYAILAADFQATPAKKWKLAFQYRGIRIYQNTEVLPRAFLAPRVLEAHGESYPLIQSLKRDTLSENSVQFHSISPQQLDVSVQTTSPQTLVLSEMNFPGWKVFINDENVNPENRATRTVERVFRSVDVGPGKSRIQWVFDSNTIRFGIFVSLVGLFLTSMFWASSWRQK